MKAESLLWWGGLVLTAAVILFVILAVVSVTKMPNDLPESMQGPFRSRRGLRRPSHLARRKNRS